MDNKLNRQAQKIVSTAVTLVLILAPMETMYASQEQQCGEPEVVLVDSMSEKNAHIRKKTAHHDGALSIRSGSAEQCASCIDKQCCCDSSSESCDMLHSMLVPPVNVFDFSGNMISFSIPFVHQRHDSPTPVSILRPPISCVPDLVVRGGSLALQILPNVNMRNNS
jgi:hypothetical protein